MSSRLVAAISAALAASPAAATAQGVFRGPYLNNVSSDAITVLWESPAPTTGVVRYRVPGGAWQAANGGGTAARHHEVRLTGLSALAPAGSELEYTLEVGGTTYNGRFRTTPVGTAPFSFIVYGDNRSSPQQHQVVVDALLREMPRAHFAMNTGDLVSSGEDEADWDAFFPVAAPLLASMPLFVAIGNHEVERNDWDVTRRIFDLPTGGVPAATSESFYRVLYGNVELIVVNVEVDSLYTVDLLAGDQEEWLTQVLAQPLAGAQHRFLFLHQGPYSSKPGRNGNFWLRQWLDALRAGGIDVIFSGHDHYAERGFTQNGLYYLVHGGGGAPLYNTLGPRLTADHTIVYGETRLGYALVHVDGPRVRVEVKGIGGEVVDSFAYGDAAAPQCVQAADCGAPPRFGCGGGAWECARSSCRFVCPADSGSLITCVTDRACEDQIGASCAGTASCEHPSINPLTWFCACILPPDCMTDADCAGRPSPLAECTGTWACTDQVCEFTTLMCLPADAGVAMDAGVAAVDAASSMDASTSSAADGTTAEDAAPIAPDAVPVADDAAVAANADAAAPPDAGTGVASTSGCGCGVAAAGDGASIALVGAYVVARRRRRRRV